MIILKNKKSKLKDLIFVFFKQKGEGFTLMEMLVAVTLFSIVITICLGIFISSLQANKTFIRMQKVQNDIRYLIDIISKEIRLGTIDYDYNGYAGNITNPVSILALRDSSNDSVYFRFNNKAVQMGFDDINWSDLTTTNIEIESMDFYIIPSSNPFTANPETVAQPMVLLYLHAYYNEAGSMDGNLRIQTVISSRQYKK